MGDALPHLGGLSVNGPAAPTATDRPALPFDISEMILTEYLNNIEVEDLGKANLLLICMGLRGTDQCNDPNDPLWKAACARFGLTKRVVGPLAKDATHKFDYDSKATPTWHDTFLAMCNEVAALEPILLPVYKRVARGERAMVHRVAFYHGRRGVYHVLADEFQQLWDEVEHVFGDSSVMMHMLRQNGLDGEGGEPMDWLSEKDEVDMFNFDGPDNDNERLRTASYHGNLAVVESLLAQGADVHYSNDEALEWASRMGRLAVVEVLLAHGANVRANGSRALMLASEYGHLAVVEVLLARGSNVHAFDDEALHWASRHGHLAVVEVLLAHGANVKPEDDRELALAKNRGHRAVAEVLIARAAEIYSWVPPIAEERVDNFLNVFLPSADHDVVTRKIVIRELERSLGLKKDALRSQRPMIKRRIDAYLTAHRRLF